MARKHVARQRFFGRWQKIPDWASYLAHIGYGAKAVVYFLVGSIAFYEAAGRHRAQSSPTQAMHLVRLQPLGIIALAALAAGMCCYGLHRVMEAALGPVGTKSYLPEACHRLGRLGGGLAYLGFAALAVRFMVRERSANSGGPLLAGRVMQYPFGNSAIVVIGGILIGVGVKYFYDALSRRYHRSYELGHPPKPILWAVEAIAVYGICSRGLFFLLCGASVIYSGLASDPSHAQGMPEVLSLIRKLPFGEWVFGVIAIGFIAYGVFCVIRAIWGIYPSDAGA
jgi:hypothetical protein